MWFHSQDSRGLVTLLTQVTDWWHWHSHDKSLLSNNGVARQQWCSQYKSLLGDISDERVKKYIYTKVWHNKTCCHYKYYQACSQTVCCCCFLTALLGRSKEKVPETEVEVTMVTSNGCEFSVWTTLQCTTECLGPSVLCDVSLLQVLNTHKGIHYYHRIMAY